MKTEILNIDDYIQQFDSEKQALLQAVRKLISELAPEATETINYKMPTFRFNGNLIHFAMFKNHLGIYPGAEAIEFFQEDLIDYKTSKGAIQLPLDKEIPEDLIRKIVNYNLEILRDKQVPDWKKHHNKWFDAIEKMEQIIARTPLEKTFKWGGDVYVFDGKNVISYAGFKNHFALWFFQGVFLEDEHQVLIAASEGRTHAQRQWRFTDVNEMDEDLILKYINEAIQLVKNGIEFKPVKAPPKTAVGIFAEALSNDKYFNEAFYKLSVSKQNEYIIYIDEAKQEKTKISRLEKIKPMILEGKGLNDKYQKRK